MASRETTLQLLETAKKARATLQSALDQKKRQKVAGVSTSRPPAARGDDFASGFGSEGLGIIGRTGGSISQAIDVGGGRLTEQDVINAVSSQSSSRQSFLEAATAPEASALRTTTSTPIRSTQSTSPSAEGGSSQNATIKRGALSDKEINDLILEGFSEGDFVPGRGVLLPDGTFDTKALEQLNEFKEKRAALQKQLEELQKQDATSAADAAVSDTAIVKTEEAAVSALNEPSPVTSEALTLLRQQEDILQKQLQAEVQSINNSYNASVATLSEEQKSEKGQLSVGLAAAGGYLGFSGSGTGVMLSLTKSHRAEMTDLKLRRDKAIADARVAYASKEFDVVRDIASELIRIDNESYNRQSAYNKEMKAAADKQKEQAQRQQTEMSIYSAIQGGATTPDAIFAKLGGEVDIDTISKFLGDLGTSDGGFKFSATQTAKLLGSGMSSDDVSALGEYVMENGYDDVVRNAMSPTQRAAADKIFRDPPKTGGKDIFSFTDQEYRKLRMAGLLDAPWNEQADYLYGESDSETFDSTYVPQIIDGQIAITDLPLEIREDVRNELYSLGFASDAVPVWFQDAVNTDANQTVSADALKSEWSTYRKSALGEVVSNDEEGPWWKFWD